MSRAILMGCLMAFSFAAHAQGSTRIASGTPLRWGMEGSIEVMEGDLARYYGSNDTVNSFRRTNYPTEPDVMSNPRANRFASVQAQCENNSTQLSWVAVQQGGADRYEIEQSPDGRNWKVAGVVLANQTDLGRASYSFTYNRNAPDVVFRIVATNIGGERVYSAPFTSPCSSTAYLGVTPNPVYSTTSIRVGSPATARVKLLVFDSRGIMRYSSDATLAQGTNTIPLDMSSFPMGYYQVVIRWMSGKQETLQLVKQ